MNYSPEILEGVKYDLEEAAVWYGDKKVGLDIGLLNEWEKNKSYKYFT